MSGFNWEAFGNRNPEPSEIPEQDARSSAPRRPHDWGLLLEPGAGLSTDAMSGLIDEFLAAAEDAQAGAESVTADAWDRDHLAHITVNAVGVVVSTEFAPDAARRSSAETLAAAVTEAAQSAASAVQTAVEAQFSPILDGIEQLDDLTPAPPGTPAVDGLLSDAVARQRRLYNQHDTDRRHTRERKQR